MLPIVASLIPSLLPAAGNLLQSVTGSGGAGGGGNIIGNLLNSVLGQQGKTVNPAVANMIRRRVAAGRPAVAPVNYRGPKISMPLSAVPPGKLGQDSGGMNTTTMIVIGAVVVGGALLLMKKR